MLCVAGARARTFLGRRLHGSRQDGNCQQAAWACHNVRACPVRACDPAAVPAPHVPPSGQVWCMQQLGGRACMPGPCVCCLQAHLLHVAHVAAQQGGGGGLAVDEDAGSRVQVAHCLSRAYDIQQSSLPCIWRGIGFGSPVRVGSPPPSPARSMSCKGQKEEEGREAERKMRSFILTAARWPKDGSQAPRGELHAAWQPSGLLAGGWYYLVLPPLECPAVDLLGHVQQLPLTYAVTPSSRVSHLFFLICGHTPAQQQRCEAGRFATLERAGGIPGPTVLGYAPPSPNPAWHLDLICDVLKSHQRPAWPCEPVGRAVRRRLHVEGGGFG